MFKDFREPWPKPERPDLPEPPRSRRDEDVLLTMVGVLLLLLLVGPFAGASVIDLVAFAIGR